MTGILWVSVVGYSIFSGAMIWLFSFRLPVLTQARKKRELENDPEAAAKHAREARLSRLGITFGMVIGWTTLIVALWLVSQ